ncbi:hypothetical protein QUA07_06930 [Microcoleus sp. T3_A4]|uniref:hypothetical protein n=1 Tax=Microcoleus sp. T3_A4 TaxID=2818968 RepID=UPI002FD132E3
MRNWELDVEGRRKKEEGRRKKEEGRRKKKEIAIRVPMTCGSCFGELPIANW